MTSRRNNRKVFKQYYLTSHSKYINSIFSLKIHYVCPTSYTSTNLADILLVNVTPQKFCFWLSILRYVSFVCLY